MSSEQRHVLRLCSPPLCSVSRPTWKICAWGSVSLRQRAGEGRASSTWVTGLPLHFREKPLSRGHGAWETRLHGVPFMCHSDLDFTSFTDLNTTRRRLLLSPLIYENTNQWDKHCVSGIRGKQSMRLPGQRGESGSITHTKSQYKGTAIRGGQPPSPRLGKAF